MATVYDAALAALTEKVLSYVKSLSNEPADHLDILCGALVLICKENGVSEGVCLENCKAVFKTNHVDHDALLN